MFDATRMQPKRLRVLLRDYRMLEGGLAVPAGQSLVSFLAGRKSYLTLHDAAWVATGERIETMALRTDRVLWIAIVDEELPMVNGRMTAEPRAVEVLLEGGMLLSGGVSLAPVQRLPDYLESAGPFIALREAILVRSGQPARSLGLVLGDVALNHAAIQAGWETAGRAATDAQETARDDTFDNVEIAMGIESLGGAGDAADDHDDSGNANAGADTALLDGFEGQTTFDGADADGLTASTLLESEPYGSDIAPDEVFESVDLGLPADGGASADDAPASQAEDAAAEDDEVGVYRPEAWS